MEKKIRHDFISIWSDNNCSAKFIFNGEREKNSGEKERRCQCRFNAVNLKAESSRFVCFASSQ